MKHIRIELENRTRHYTYPAIIERLPDELMTSCEYRKYILEECQRQWKECQEEEYGPWSKQSLAEKEDYYQSLYEQYSDLLGKSCSDCAKVRRNQNGGLECYKLDRNVMERNFCNQFEEV